MICEKAVGIIVPIPWNRPRSTPITERIIRDGARTKSAYTESGVFKIFVIVEAPKNTIKAAIDKIVKNNYKAAKKAMKNAEKAMA